MTAGVKYNKLHQQDDTEEKSSPQTRGSCLKRMAKNVIIFALLALLLAICSSIFVDGYFVAYPMHASCKVDWNFDIACSDVNSALVNQMKEWEGSDNCEQGKVGEKCLYELKSANSTRIEGTHTTPVKSYTDDISFDLAATSSGGCKVHGFSTSQTWYAYLDYGTNYCNLHNLITGSGLDKQPGYKEMTSDSICTQYTDADCTKY